MFEIAVTLIRSKENHNICVRIICPYSVRRRIHYISAEVFFDLNHSGWQNHNSIKEHKTILMTVPTGILVVADDYFDGIYAQVRVLPRVPVCVSLYDRCVHVCFIDETGHVFTILFSIIIWRRSVHRLNALRVKKESWTCWRIEVI